jgi:hypothetical protein
MFLVLPSMVNFLELCLDNCLIKIALILFVAQVSFAEDVKPTIFTHKGKKFEAYPYWWHACSKKKEMVIYQVFDNRLGSNNCAVQNHEYACLNYDKPQFYEKPDIIEMNTYHCPRRKVHKPWKTIFTSLKSSDECAKKVEELIEKLKKKNFVCRVSPLG